MLGVAYTCTYASSQIFLGFGSAWYHASLAFVGQFIDNAGMFLAVSAPLLFARASLRRRDKSGKSIPDRICEPKFHMRVFRLAISDEQAVHIPAFTLWCNTV